MDLADADVVESDAVMSAPRTTPAPTLAQILSMRFSYKAFYNYNDKIYNFKGWASENVVVLRCTSVPHNYSLFFDI